jgi:hypothetical protein
LFQDFQKDVVKAAEAFTAIGYRHIEAGEKTINTPSNHILLILGNVKVD